MKMSRWKQGWVLCMAFSVAVLFCGCSPTVTEPQVTETAVEGAHQETALEWPPEGFSMEAPTVASVDPHLATGALTHARLPPCRMMIPVREEVGRKFEGRVNMVHVNVGEYPVLGMRYSEENIPHMIFFDADGLEAGARQGPRTVEELARQVVALGVEE